MTSMIIEKMSSVLQIKSKTNLLIRTLLDLTDNSGEGDADVILIQKPGAKHRKLAQKILYEIL